MPDTLAHFGVQILASKAVCRQADVRWIGLGCLLPDLPWILQRAVLPLALLEPINLRLYVIIQSSLLFCLLLAAAISLQSANSCRIFLLLAWNCLLHLLLDPLEIKWGNGTVLFAPLSWRLTSFAYFWPEELPTQLLALTGLLVLPITAWLDRQQNIRFIKDRTRQGAGLLLLLLYLLLPLCLFNGPLQADSHYAATLLAPHRTGRLIAFDRRPFRAAEQTLLSYSGEELRLTGGNLPAQDGILSLQGCFVNQQTIRVAAWHLHSSRRDLHSQLGIFLLLSIWLVALSAKRITISQPC
jgi:hypothetical protein